MKTKTILITLIAMLTVTVLVFQSCEKEEEKINQPPTCEITAPTNNQSFVKGETIAISVEANDNDGNITEVRFAIDGVGKGSDSSYPFNYNWSTIDESIGSHTIKATCIDNDGDSSSDEITIELTENGSGNTPPTALYSVSPTSGTTSTNFAFDASGSTDNEDPTSDLQVRWDFDGNGSWDTNWDTEKNQNHQYSSENTYTAKLEVKDTEGLTNQYSKSITVSNSGETGTFTDPRDGQTYNTVDIGNQTWMAENLNYASANSWTYDDDPANGDVYGRLYPFDAALIACPSGWSLPDDEEWKTMEMALGMSQSEADKIGFRGTDEGGKMKSTSGWHNNGNGTNSSGFNGLPGGWSSRSGGTGFYHLGDSGFWWSSTDVSGTHAQSRYLIYQVSQVYRTYYPHMYGLSIRCIKD